MRKVIFANAALIFIILAQILYIQITEFNSRVFIQSPDKTKTITLYKTFSPFNTYYLIPYKYTDTMPPFNDYCCFTLLGGLPLPFGDEKITPLEINWHPKDKKYNLKVGICDEADNHLVTAYGGKKFYDDEPYFYNYHYAGAKGNPDDEGLNYDENKYSLFAAELFLQKIHTEHRSGKNYMLLVVLGLMVTLVIEAIVFVASCLFFIYKMFKR